MSSICSLVREAWTISLWQRHVVLVILRPNQLDGTSMTLLGGFLTLFEPSSGVRRIGYFPDLELMMKKEA